MLGGGFYFKEPLVQCFQLLKIKEPLVLIFWFFLKLKKLSIFVYWIFEYQIKLSNLVIEFFEIKKPIDSKFLNLSNS
jgi:hypothetical protein